MSSSAARVRDIDRMAGELGCSTELADAQEWAAFQASLPANAAEEAEGIEEAGEWALPTLRRPPGPGRPIPK